MTHSRFSLQKAQGVLDGVDQRPAQLKQLAAGALSEDKPRQRSVGARPALGQLAAKLGQGERLATLDLGEPLLQRQESVRIGEDRRGFLQCLVLIDSQYGRRGGLALGVRRCRGLASRL